MSNASLIIGESGTGKSTSIRNLNPKETFIINVCNKPLPFRGYKNLYKTITGWEDKEGNYYASNDYQKIIRCLKMIDKDRPEILNVIIDDFQYVMCAEFMNRVTERGFDKFSEIGQHAYMIIDILPTLRDDLNCFVLSHSEANEHGKMKVKTIGKLLDDKVVLEGRFTMVLQTEISESGYRFITQGDKNHIAKSPMDMFEDKYIPNDLAFVILKMNAYNHGVVAA
jgi:hypothetical protein